MGGKLWFTSKEGAGSTFTFTIQLHRCSSLSPKVSDGMHKMAVMIIEPNEKRRKIVSRMLQNIGVSPIPLSSCQEALQFSKTQPRKVKLILVDNRETREAISSLESITNCIVQTGITPRLDSWPFWKSPIRESNLIDQLVKFTGHAPAVGLKKSNGTQNLCILLAEDNVMNQKMIQRLLKSSGYNQVDVVYVFSNYRYLIS
jgi:CheY-like chemotaxis protein